MVAAPIAMVLATATALFLSLQCLPASALAVSSVILLVTASILLLRHGPASALVGKGVIMPGTMIVRLLCRAVVFSGRTADAADVK